jgi:lysophospholipase L1-like esterase
LSIHGWVAVNLERGTRIVIVDRQATGHFQMLGNHLKKIGLSAASSLITLIALEIALRLCGYNPLGDWREGRNLAMRPSIYPDLKYELTPGGSDRGWGTDIKINSQGFRGLEPSSNPSTHRVIVLGDSIAFGNNLPLEDTFSFQLQQRLFSQGRDVEILNFGVGGYDTLQEVSLLEIRGLKYHPDLVVVAYCLNDISISSVSLEHIQRMQPSHFSFLYESRLAQLISVSIETIRVRNWLKHMNEPQVFHREYENQIDPITHEESELLNLMNQAPKWPSTTWYGDRDRVGRLRFGFRRLARISKENGFPVVIMIVPLLLERAGAYSHRAAHRIVEMEARRAGFDTIDLTDEFIRAGMGNLKISLGDITHPNKAGHTIMANSLSAFIAEHMKRSP